MSPPDSNGLNVPSAILYPLTPDTTICEAHHTVSTTSNCEVHHLEVLTVPGQLYVTERMPLLCSRGNVSAVTERSEAMKARRSSCDGLLSGCRVCSGGPESENSNRTVLSALELLAELMRMSSSCVLFAFKACRSCPRLPVPVLTVIEPSDSGGVVLV